MEFLGVGVTELIFIVIIALIVLGPRDMVKAGRTVGRFLRRLVTSPTWLMLQQTSRDLRNLPTRLMRDAGMEGEAAELKQLGQDLKKQSDMLRSIRNPLQNAAQEIEGELKSAAAAAAPPTGPAAPPTGAATNPPGVSGLSAWTTPPAPPWSPSTPPPAAPGPAEPDAAPNDRPSSPKW
ncbi:MAG: hypothetical protein ACKOC5_04325 [Chloroflexota bacterium]